MNWVLITILPIGIVLGVLAGRRRRIRRGGNVARMDARTVVLTFLTALCTVVFAEAARVALGQASPHLIWMMIGSACIAMASSNALVAHEHRHERLLEGSVQDLASDRSTAER